MRNIQKLKTFCVNVPDKKFKKITSSSFKWYSRFEWSTAVERFHSNSRADELRLSNYDRPRVQTQAFSEEREEGPVDDDEIHRFLELQKFIRGELFAESTYFDSGNKGNGENNEKDSRSQGIRPEVEDVFYGDTVESEKERVARKEKEGNQADINHQL